MGKWLGTSAQRQGRVIPSFTGTPGISVALTGPMLRVLLVEPDTLFRSWLSHVISDLAEVRCVSTFAEARSAVAHGRVDLLVTNLRLGPFNGLHLVHLADALATQTRALVYTEQLDMAFGQEVQRAGAFYDTRRSLPHTLASYVGAVLPPQDRRHLRIDDRQAVEGGRRSADRARSRRLASNGARITGRVG
jgi:DNA-binding NarL/FixJ family response regulator